MVTLALQLCCLPICSICSFVSIYCPTHITIWLARCQMSNIQIPQITYLMPNQCWSLEPESHRHGGGVQHTIGNTWRNNQASTVRLEVYLLFDLSFAYASVCVVGVCVIIPVYTVCMVLDVTRGQTRRRGRGKRRNIPVWLLKCCLSTAFYSDSHVGHCAGHWNIIRKI